MHRKFSVFILFLCLINNACCFYHLTDKEKREEVDSYKRYLFIFVGASAVVTIRHVVRHYNVPVPYRAFAIFLGILWGLIAWQVNWLHLMSICLTQSLIGIETIFLPVIIYTTAFTMDVRAFIKSLGQILVIAIPISLTTCCFLGLLMSYVIDNQNHWKHVDGILLAVISASTYPAEVLRWLRETTIRTKYVTILLEGETLISAAFSVSVTHILFMHIQGFVVEWYQFAMIICRMVIIGVPLGYLFGYLGASLMKFAYNDASNLMLLTVAISYTSYFFGEWIANSGVIATAITGAMMAKERSSLSKEIEESLLHLWKLISVVVNSILFFLIGIYIPLKLKMDETPFNQYITVCVTYMMSNIIRFVSFFVFSPILSRIGYGMTFQNLVVCFWGGIKNPVCFYLAIETTNVYRDQKLKANLFFLHTVGVFILTLLINGSFVRVLFRAIGLAEISTSRQVNMNNCMKYVYEARARTVAILKMDRFLSDANWPLVMSSTALKHPYQKNMQTDSFEGENEEDYFFGYKFTYCPDCEKQIPNEPTPKEFKEMTKEAKLRILKLKKTTFSRQYENGMLSKDGARMLHQAVEIGMDTDEAIIELDGLFILFTEENSCLKCLTNHLQTAVKTRVDDFKPPRRKSRLWCFNIIRHPGYFLLMNLVVLLHMILLTVTFQVAEHKRDFLQNASFCINTIFFLIYLVEFYVKILAYSWINILRHGFVGYFRSFWNILEFIILLFTLTSSLVEVPMMLLHDVATNYEWHFDVILNIFLAARICRILFYYNLCDFFKTIANKIIKYLTHEMERHKALAYELGKSYIKGEEEILENLNQIVDNDKIREKIREMTENDRQAVTKRLGLAQKETPWVATTVKTKSAIRTVLNAIKDDIFELKVSGWADDVEYNKLLNSLAERYKYVNTINSVAPCSPKLILREVSYMGDDDDVFDYLYSNVATRKFDPGDVVFEEGAIVEGILILITGMFLVSYTPKKETIDKLKDIGALPVLDYICSYEEQKWEYLIPGNTMGELSAVTERPYNGMITAETHSEVYLIKRHVVKKALELDSDPVNGLECRIWKTIAFRTAVSVMMKVPSYRSYTQEKIKYIIEKSFIPNLTNYKVFVVNEMMQDIILIEGIVVDYNTRDVYTGPCYIPRAVHRLAFPKSSLVNIKIPLETKLMIVPAKDYDEYEIMLTEEQTSELVSNESSKSLRHLMQEKAAMSSQGSKIKKGLKLFSKQIRKKFLRADSSVKSRITFASSGKSKSKSPISIARYK